MSQGRGRPEKYTQEVCEHILVDAKHDGVSLKEFCRLHDHVYITLIVALKRHGLSPRAQVAKHTPAGQLMANANAGGVVLMDEEDTEQAIAEIEGAE